MRIRLLPILLLLLTALPVFADDVYLVNGRKFEGVMTETTDSQVRIQMQGGVIVLPRSQVLRVEAGDSNLAELLRRREALKKNPGTRAADWLELARWAQSRQLDQATRESALAAATLDPRAPGVASLLRGYGYVLDEQMDRWVPYADAMRRKGFVQVGSQWISREEYQAKLRDQQDEEARRRADRDERARAAREERIAALTELALTRELTRPDYGRPPVLGPYTPWGEPVILLPGFVVTPPVVMPPMMPGEPRNHGHDGRDPASGSLEFIHIPGSLIPGRLPGQH
ncbi:MAG: hypothetical protein QOF89_987 [Acidobacteriota bacterium]|jgi:hypothetical protein|nr:hypothetical protein [Acidobacteriota bacterium]